MQVFPAFSCPIAIETAIQHGGLGRCRGVLNKTTLTATVETPNQSQGGGKRNGQIQI